MSDTRYKLINRFRRFAVMGGSLYGGYQIASTLALATGSAMVGGVGIVLAVPACYQMLNKGSNAIMSMAGMHPGHSMGGYTGGFASGVANNLEKDFSDTRKKKPMEKEEIKAVSKEIPFEKFSFKRERPVVNPIKEAEVVRGMDDYSEGRKKVD